MGEEEQAIKTAFYDIQAAMGATFAPDGGWLWTDSFGDIGAEYKAVREDVGMWDVSPLNKWDWRGPDAGEAAQRVNGNDIAGLQVDDLSGRSIDRQVAPRPVDGAVEARVAGRHQERPGYEADELLHHPPREPNPPALEVHPGAGAVERSKHALRADGHAHAFEDFQRRTVDGLQGVIGKDLRTRPERHGPDTRVDRTVHGADRLHWADLRPLRRP